MRRAVPGAFTSVCEVKAPRGIGLHSTFTWLLEPMIERSGFEIAAAERSDDGVFAQYVLRAA